MGEYTPGPWTCSGGGFDDECGVYYTLHAEGMCISKANARLITAAPELLDIAERMMEVLEFAYMGAPEQPKEIAQYRAIRAKILKP